MTFISATEVRNVCGAPSSLISDTVMNQYITEVEAEMARWINTAFVPTEKIDIVDGNSTGRMFVMKNPILSVRALTLNTSTAITPSEINWYKSSGKIMLGTDAEAATFTSGQQNTFIKYLYGMLEESSTSTSSTADVVVGTTVTVPVTAITGFAKEDWVEIYGMDGKREAAQISAAPSGTDLVVDQLVQTHSSGSQIVKLEIPQHIKKYMLIEAGICAAINAIGATYTFNASYSLGELQVTKGVPYTHWRESVQRLMDERKMRQARIKPRPSILVN